MFTSNFIGVVFSRSLHFQFYSWYFHTLPHLLFSTKLPAIVNVALIGAIEVAWNVFPPVPWASVLLQACHWIVLLALLFASDLPPAFYLNTSSTNTSNSTSNSTTSAASSNTTQSTSNPKKKKQKTN